MAPSASAPRKVLFVEDEAALQYAYERFFQGKYTMAYAPNGAEAMRQLNEFHPDVLVLDMRLPDTDGIALLQRIRETQPTLPVVVTTTGRVGRVSRMRCSSAIPSVSGNRISSTRTSGSKLPSCRMASAPFGA